MSNQVEVTLAFLLYILFFAWVGYLRGSRRELIVFAVAALGWLVLNQQGDRVVFLVNIFSRLFNLVIRGGLSSPEAMAGAPPATPWVDETRKSGFLFLLWVILLLAAYWYTSWPSVVKHSHSDGWAAILGILNGLFLTSVLLPRLISIVPTGLSQIGSGTSEVGASTFAPMAGLVELFWSIIRWLLGFVLALWEYIQPQRSLVILLFLLLIMGLTAYTLRGSPRGNR